MFRTKKDVDKHVQDINSKIKNSSERALKGYAIAKLYHTVGDFESARRHLGTYLLEKDTSAVAHKLQGEILEKLGQPEKALQAYKRAHELEASADLVNRICRIMADLPVEPGRAKYWIEVGEKSAPHSEAVLRLREAMLAATEGENGPALEEVLKKEIEARPGDVTLRIRLASLYQRVGRIEEGWKMVTEVEASLPWPQSKDWYLALVEMAENYQVQYKSKCGAGFYQVYISGLDRLVGLLMRDNSATSLIADNVHRMDQAVHELGQCCNNPNQSGLQHLRGQLALNCAALIAKRALKEPSTWRDGSKLAGILYMLAWNLEGGNEEGKSSSRKAIAGHMLRSLQGDDVEWAERLVGQAGPGLGERLHKAVFCARDQRAASSTSWLAQQSTVSSFSVPSLAEIAGESKGYLEKHKADLHFIVWLLSRHYIPGKVLELGFPLPWSESSTRETLNSVDMASFLYGIHYSSGWASEDEPASSIPLPPSLAPNLTSTVQESWWEVACKALSHSLQPVDRRTLQHGVEALRCTGLHGLDVNLTMKLAKTFEMLSLDKDTLSNQVDEVEARAALYYRASLASIDLIEQGRAPREPITRLLPPAGRPPTSAEVEKMRLPAKLFLAIRSMHGGQTAEALASFRELRCPEASFYSGEIHRKLASEERSVSGLMGEVTSKYREQLQEAREAFYLTLDRIRGLGQTSHPLDAVLAEQIEEVEQLIASANMGLLNGTSRPEVVDVSTNNLVNGSQFGSTPIRPLPQRLQTSTPSLGLFEANSSLREEARPSPERLDAQMRQLTSELGRTTSTLARTLSHVEEKENNLEVGLLVEQGKELVATGKLLVEEVKQVVPLVKEVAINVKEMRSETMKQGEKVVALLQKIADSSSTSGGSRQGELSDEERMLLESFAMPGLPSLQVQQQQQLGLLQQQFLQQQLASAAAVQQQLARQQPLQQPQSYLAPASIYPAMQPLPQAVLPQQPVPLTVTPAAAVPSIQPTISNMPTMPNMPTISKATNAPTTGFTNLAPSGSAAPNNVVMNMSDPIPAPTTHAPPPLAVTVPPHHRLGGSTPRQVAPPPSTASSSTPIARELFSSPFSNNKAATPVPETPPTPHSFQMTMPAGASPLVNSPFPTEAGPAVPLTTTSLLSSINTPTFSAVTPSPDRAAALSGQKARAASGGAKSLGETPKKGDQEDGAAPEDYEPEVNFTPVIPLPDKVEVVTGEEEEEVIFEDKSKLYRWDANTKEWKERGVGQAKILKRKDTGKVRFLMRREQTFKVCANHTITDAIKIQPMKGQAKARIWGAQDFADEELKDEKFCIRFKTEEQAAEFEAKFLEATELSKKAADTPMKDEKKKEEKKTLAQFAASQKAGKWECPLCLTSNPESRIQCLACEAARPGYEEEVAKMKTEAAPVPAVMTIGAGGGFKFGGGAASSSQASGFSFGAPASSSGAASTTTTSVSTGFTFGSANSASSGFGSVVAPASAASTSSSTKSLGGFTFSQAPVVVKPKPVEVEEKKKEEEAAKPSPFSGFSFGSASTAGSSAPTLTGGAKAEIVSSTLSVASEPLMFGSKPSQGFDSVAAAGGTFKADPNFQGFAGAGSAVFGGGAKKEDKEGDDGGAEEEYEPTGEFTPVIPLPELVEVKTGEEEEEVLFSERAVLFRYVQDTKEWKERGRGDFKILKNPATGKARFLMRREQVLKVCCNHVISKELDIKPQGSSDRAWTWTAADFSEGEVTNELLALRFKTGETAAAWKAVVDKVQSEVNTVTSTKVTDGSKGKEEQGSKVEEAGTSKGMTLAQFAASQKSGKWECPLCLTSNPESRIQCLACEAARPGYEEEVAKMKAEAAPAPAVMTIGAGGGFKFGGGAVSTTTQASGFSFGSSSAATTTSSGFGPVTTTTASGFTFGSTSSPGFSFSKPATTSNGTAPTTSTTPFGGSAAHEFKFSGVKSPEKADNKADDSAGDESELYQEEENDNLYFEPVIPLPDKVDVVTGEEEEEVLYSHRAKLFRLVDGEWKERGIGDVKILKHKTSKKIRLLMRREQVLKICLNHALSASVVSMIKEKTANSWTWVAQDFSDGELATMTFAIRFKTAEIAKDFKTACEDSVKDLELTPKKGETTKLKADVAVKEKTPKDEKPSSITSSEAEDGTDLFPVSAFKPVEDVAKEVELSFEGQGLKLNTAEEAADVAKKIREAATVHILTFSANTIGIEAAGEIGKALEGHPEFRRAHWKDMFTGRMKSEIPPALVNLTRGVMIAHATLTELDLSDNAFGPVGMEGLKVFLQSPSCYTLKELKLNNTGCGVTGGKMLASLLKSCYHKSKAVGHPLALKVFVLGRSRQENEGGKALAEVFQLMGSLEEVVMPQNGIYHEGLAALAEAFSHNPNLKILNMNDNTFTSKGAKAMASALKKLEKLEVLNLGDCLLKSAGAKLICRALKGRHPGLKELVLDSNEIRVKAADDLAKAVKGKTSLERVSISGNQFGASGLKRIQDKFKELGVDEMLEEIEDNEEPDSDEEDPDVSEEEEEEEAPQASTTAKAAFSFTPSSSSSNTTSIFGGASKPAGGSVFGGAAAPSSSLFGSSSSSPFKPAGNLFSAPASSIFSPSSKASSPSSIFSTVKTEASSSSIFSTPAKTEASNIFSKPADSTTSTGLFGKPVTQDSSKGIVFGASPITSPQSSSSEATSAPESSISANAPIFGSSATSGAFNFTALAGSATGEGLKTATEGFKFSGAGSSLFSSPATKQEDEDGDGEEVEGGHDPYFEPIVPLPELVEVKTGEEDEEVLFKHRAKVYRYCGETKQWKERGVGDIKILKHKVSAVHRVLLRRDQVHKIAANHRITPEMELKPLASSETAWCWYAMDFSEGHEAEGSLEHLAVRFKTADTAQEFKKVFEECQAGKTATASTTNSSATSAVTERAPVQPDPRDEEEEEEYGEEDEDYEAGETIMFHQSGVSLSTQQDGGEWVPQGEVDFRIVYDDDVYGARIIAEGPTAEGDDEYNVICNHLIAMQTILADDMSWSALDFSMDPPTYRTFRVEFSSPDTVAEFRDMFAEGKELAEQSEILETVGDQDPSHFYYGQGADGEA